MAKVILTHPVMKFDDGDMHYFGEVDLSGKKAEPAGPGLIAKDDGTYAMFENAATFDGMAIYGDGTAGCVTYAANGEKRGPYLHFHKDEDFCFDLINESGNRHKVSIRIKKDGTYTISQYDEDGFFTHKVLSFKKSLFCLEYRLSEEKERTAVVEKKVGWNFKYPFVPMFLMPYDSTKSVVPSYISGTSGVCTYIGGAQTSYELFGDCVSKFSDEEKSNFNYIDFARNSAYNAIDEEIFHSLSKFGYAVHYYSDGVRYFGEIFDNKFSGIGCIKYDDCDYLGYVSNGDSPYGVKPYRTGMKVYRDGTIQFGSFETMGDDVIFEIHDDFLYILSYYRGSRRGSYYKLKFDTFDLEEYNESDALTESVPFPPVADEMRRDDGKKARIKTKLTPEELLDNDVREALSAYKYRVPKVNQIEVYEYLREVVKVEVPDIVTKICTETFAQKKIHTLYLPEKLTELESGSLAGMKNLLWLKFNENCKVKEIPSDVCDSPVLREVKFPKSVERIREGAFINCKKLKKAFVYAGCVVEERAFPRHCKVIYVAEDGYTRLKKKGKESTQAERSSSRESRVRTRSASSFSFGSAIGSVFGAIFGVITFPFRILFKLFKWLFCSIGSLFASLFGGLGSLGAATNVFSVVSFVVILVCAILNFFDFDETLLEWWHSVCDGIGTWFGMRLVEHCTNLMDNMTSDILLSLLLWLPLLILLIVTFVFECVLNALCGVLWLVCFVLYFVIGLGYYFAIPIGMLVLSIIGLVKDKTATNIALLVLTIGAIAVFYVGLCIGL